DPAIHLYISALATDQHTSTTAYVSFFFHSSGAHRDLHSFPTRRSSDLRMMRRVTSGPNPFDRVASYIPRNPSPVIRMPYRTPSRSEEHTSELQSLRHLVCRLLLEKKKKKKRILATSGHEQKHTLREPSR